MNLTCHNFNRNSWDWCYKGRYDYDYGVVLSKEIKTKFHSIYQ
jgi:hypothetical protein